MSPRAPFYRVACVHSNRLSKNNRLPMGRMRQIRQLVLIRIDSWTSTSGATTLSPSIFPGPPPLQRAFPRDYGSHSGSKSVRSKLPLLFVDDDEYGDSVCC